MISSIITSPALYNITQTTHAQVSIETGLKAIGRPSFILLDKNIDHETKKYSAMKELIYQLTCMAVSLLVVIPLFKKGSFGAARKLFKDEKVFNVFNKSDEFNKYYKLSQAEKDAKLLEMSSKAGETIKSDDINEHLAKGVIETSSILGSILGLSILSPIIARSVVRPVLKAIGLRNDDNDTENADTQLDIKA